MKLSLNWIKDYVKLPDDMDLSRLAYDLTMSTVEVEGAHDLAKDFENIIVGVICEVLPHPNADKLRVCRVDIGEGEIKDIVCGGSNLEVNQKVAVAVPGTFVKWHGEGEPVEIKVSKLRGVESYGMICASSEIGLFDLFPFEEEATIVDLTEERPRLLRPGGITPEELMAVLGDLVVDKAVTAQIDKDEVVKAPGMKYRHYAPSEPVVIVSGSREKAAAYIRSRFCEGDRVLCFEEELPLYEGCDPLSYGLERDAETLSAGLFAALRTLDETDVKTVYARCPVGGGVAYAVQNRLKKAAGFRVVDAEETV